MQAAEVLGWLGIGRRTAEIPSVIMKVVKHSVGLQDPHPMPPMPGPPPGGDPIAGPTLKQMLGDEMRPVLVALERVLPHVSGRDIRFGRRAWPARSFAELLEESWPSSLLEPMREQILRLHRMHTSPQLLLDELDELLPRSRPTEIARARWGWDGGGRKTLAAVGRSYQLTRERVRQIADSVKSKLLEGRPAYLPTTTAVMALVNELGGVGYERDLGRIALEHGLVRSVDDVQVLPSLSELGLISGDASILVRQVADEMVYGADARAVDELALVATIVRRELARRGIVGVAATREAIKSEGVSATEAEVRAVMDRQGGLEALANGAYFWRPSDDRSRVMGVIRKPLTLRGPQTAHALAGAIERKVSRRPKYGARVPLHVLTEALDRSPFLRRDSDGRYAWTGELSEPKLHPIEKAILEVIDRDGPAVTYNTVLYAVAPHGINPVTMELYLTTSPLFDRIERGVYRAIGTDVTPAEVARAHTVSPGKRVAGPRKRDAELKKRDARPKRLRIVRVSTRGTGW